MARNMYTIHSVTYTYIYIKDIPMYTSFFQAVDKQTMMNDI